ncbi:MAG: DUF4365 domain-containing protein, partial [Candidatus Obscuribacterales bacterium]|nr:DUF4365 domain-containing protein [Candidatus Obscuribacterales bacterium]
MTNGISENHKEESISLAHVYAIAGKAGMVVHHSNFDYGVDGTFGRVQEYKKQIIEDGYTLPFQLKACINIKEKNSSEVTYVMKGSAYERLRIRNDELNKERPQLLLVCDLHNDNAH